MDKNLSAPIIAILGVVVLMVVLLILVPIAGSLATTNQDAAVSLLESDGFSVFAAGQAPTDTPTFLVCSSTAQANQCDYEADGTTDEIQIENAIGDCPSTGCRILLTEGEFSIDSQVDIEASNITLSGVGRSTHLICTARICGIRVAGEAASRIEGNVVSDLFVEGSDDTNNGDVNGSGILVTNAKDFIVRNVWVEKAPYDGILALTNVSEGIIHNNVVRGSSTADVGDDGINILTGQSGTLTANIVVEGNHVSGIEEDCIHHSGGIGVTIVGNTISDCGEDGIASFPFNEDSFAVIDGNFITNPSVNGIDIGAGLDRGDFTSRAVITDNFIEGGGDGSGIVGAIHIRVSAASGDSGLISEVIISGNEVKEFSGLQVRVVGRSDNKIETLHFSDNFFHSSIGQDAVDIVHVNNVVFSGNTVEKSDTGNSLELRNSGTASVQSNHFNHSGGSSILNLSSNTTEQVRNNTGHITEKSGTATIPSGSTSVTVSHGISDTPTSGDCTFVGAEDPDNSPGAHWIDGFSSTQMILNVENDPGASNYDVAWTCTLY